MMATVAAALIALALPENFDTALTMTFQQKGDVRWHPTRDAASFADKLLANGAPEDIALAEKVLNAVMACQETRPGDPHFGNFWWYREDEKVEDLNAVQFVLITSENGKTSTIYLLLLRYAPTLLHMGRDREHLSHGS